MKKNLNTFVSLAVCAALVVCIFRINSLEKEINALRSSTIQRVDNISTDINRIYYNIDDKLKQNASIITADSRQIISADIATNTAQVACSVTAKEYVPGETQAFVYVNGQEFELPLMDGKFTGNITVPVTSDTHIEMVSFTENGTVRNQPVNWYFSPRYEYLTLVYADFSWNGRGSKVDENDAPVYCWQIDNGDISVDIDREKGDIHIKSIGMVEVIDGTEVRRTPIPLIQPTEKEKAEAAGLWQSTQLAVPEYDGYAEQTNFRYSLDGYVFEIPYGSTLDVFVETVDGDNLVHRNQIAQWAVTEDGEYIEEHHEWWHGAEGFIYDMDGNLLYGN